MEYKQGVLIIVGPTASGKSALAVELARRFNGEVISADSRQVYRGLDIGTGKITRREMRGIPHHLLDIAVPRKAFSAGDFVARARCAIADISARGKLPIIAGGTGFYIDALAGRMPLPDVPPNPTMRKKLAGQSAAQLFALLKKKDPARASMMDTPSERNNRVRLIRALEIAAQNRQRSQTSPKPSPKRALEIASSSEKEDGLSRSYRTNMARDVLWIGINPPFKVLEQKIAMRLSARLKSGMIAESKRLHAGGLSYKRMEELGLEYRSLARFLQGKITRTELEIELQRDIRRYAKHQLAYWKRNGTIEWFKPNESKKIERKVIAWYEGGR